MEYLFEWGDGQRHSTFSPSWAKRQAEILLEKGQSFTLKVINHRMEV